MARTKQTPRNPNVDRPVVAVGSDIQSAERRLTPRSTQGKVQNKGGKQPRKHITKKLSKQSIVLASTSSGTDEEDKIGYETDLSTEDTDFEINTDTRTWSTADKKKLQHMTEFHKEYQCVFGEGASIRTIMKRRISHMNPSMPKAVCEEEVLHQLEELRSFIIIGPDW